MFRFDLMQTHQAVITTITDQYLLT